MGKPVASRGPLSGRTRTIIHIHHALFGICMIAFAAYSTDARRNTNECSEPEFSECLKSFDTIIAHQNLGFAATEKDLDDACRFLVTVHRCGESLFALQTIYLDRYLKEGVTCIDQFVKRCTRDKAEQDSLTVSVKGAFDILELLCEDTYHRNQYLQHAECYRRIAPQIEDCMGPMRATGLRHQGGQVPAKAKVNQVVCCAYHNATECINQVAVKECSDRAATFLKNYTDRAAYPITLQCRSFNSKVCRTGTSDSCPALSSQAAAWLMVPVLAAAYIINV